MVAEREKETIVREKKSQGLDMEIMRKKLEDQLKQQERNTKVRLLV